MQILKATLGAVLLASIATVAQAGEIRVTGQGSVQSQPDMATITLGVTNQAKTATQAMSENSDATRVVLEGVMQAGIAERDVQTSGLSLSPNWNNRTTSNGSAPQIVGYIANNHLTIRVRDLTTLGGVLDQVVQGGANRFNGLSFGLQEPQPKTDQARRNAVADALRKANLYAQAAGVELGPIVEISELGAASPGPVMMREMAMADAVPIAQGEVAVQASVTVVFEIAE